MQFLADITKNPLLIGGFYPVSGKRKNFFVTVGMPGTGKSTFCCNLYKNCLPGTAKLICRDVVRAAMVWHTKNLTSEQQELVHEDIDNVVTERVVNIFSETLADEPDVSTFIIDGCHTSFECLRYLLEAITGACGMKEVDFAIHLCVIGTPLSKINHTQSNRLKNDFSDYNQDGSHTAVPACIVKQKREEFWRLVTPTLFEFIIDLCDYIYSIPSYDPDDFN